MIIEEVKNEVRNSFPNAEIGRIYFARQNIVPLVHRIYPLEDARAAHEEMAAGRHFGNIVLQVQ